MIQTQVTDQAKKTIAEKTNQVFAQIESETDSAKANASIEKLTNEIEQVYNFERDVAIAKLQNP